MFTEIIYNKNCPVNFENRDKFEAFIREYTISKLFRVIKVKTVYLNQVLEGFDISCNDILNNLKPLVKTIKTKNGFKLYLSPRVEIKGVRITTVIKAVDFGSTISGVPKPIFYPILREIKNNISRHYLQYLGLM